MWAIVIEILHHPIPASRSMWELHLHEIQWWTILWTTPSEYRGWRRWKFLGQVLATATICRQHLTNKIPMKRLIQEQRREYNTATNCSICAKPFKSADKKVRDHNHLTVKYRGPAGNACNLNYRIDPKRVKIQCIIHNLKGMLFLCYSYFHEC